MPRPLPLRLSIALAVSWLTACGSGDGTPEADTVGPLGIPTVQDGQLYAGAAFVDVTPVVTETFTDLDGDATFDGCHDDPAAAGEGCDEPFDDVDGDGTFDGVWIGGFGFERAAQGVNEGDGIGARAIVLAHDAEYVAVVALDSVGLGDPPIARAREILAEDGFDIDRLVVSATHSHQGPDTLGFFGDPFGGLSGAVPAYQERVSEAIAASVREAAASMEAVSLTVDATRLREASPWLTGSNFGGKNPRHTQHGGIHDIRDPLIVADQLLVMQAASEQGVVFTLASWSGHPEVWGSRNPLLSSDYVDVLRDVLEDRYGGVGVFWPESLGGMQSSLAGELPLRDEDGAIVYATCDAEAVADPDDGACFGAEVGSPRVDADGDPVPVWAEQDTWDFVAANGWFLADAATDLLVGAEPVEVDRLHFDVELAYVPVRNTVYQLLGPSGIFDIGADQVTDDPALCPEAPELSLGCLPVRTSRLVVGPVGFLGIPGEVNPEVSWGLPTDDPQWAIEAADPSARGPGSRYFPQHPPACDGVAWEDCRDVASVGDCDCLDMHAVPFDLAAEGTTLPLLDHLDTEFKAVIGCADGFVSYIVPPRDHHDGVSLISGDAGDHYEETVGFGFDAAVAIGRAQDALSARWPTEE